MSILLQLETLLVKRDPVIPAVARVWLNRPKRRNALNTQCLEDICTAFAFLERKYEFTVVILGGYGRSFSSGADLKDPPGQLGEEGATGRARRHAIQVGRRAIAAIEHLDAITIARVQGHAIGGGFGLMCACDLRIVTMDTRLYLPEVDIAVPLTWGLTTRLIRDVGRPKAMELITLCDDLPPIQALSLGLINKVVADEQALDAAVDGWAARLAAKNGTALHLVKTQFRASDYSADLGNVTEFDNDWLLYREYLDRQKARL
jgi:enoyl-CoA hydratase/carnithine racemase